MPAQKERIRSSFGSFVMRSVIDDEGAPSRENDLFRNHDDWLDRLQPFSCPSHNPENLRAVIVPSGHRRGLHSKVEL